MHLSSYSVASSNLLDHILSQSFPAEPHCHALGFQFAESPRRQAVQEVPEQADSRA